MNTNITVDFQKTIGKIKPMHGVGQPPFLGINYSYMKYLKDAHIPYARLHDVGGPFGGNIYVDVPNIFRDFDADETDPENYDFAFTDLLLKNLHEYGCSPVYRLGITIECNQHIRRYRTDPPKDYHKWARICEHIIRHYNEGWANGFEFGIEYWEIWNEPDGNIAPEDNGMWHGTKEEFFELYKVAASYLKNCFGDKIKIGGYGSCGFPFIDEIIDEKELSAAYTTVQTIKWQKRIRYFKVFFEEFMEMVSKENVPLDFFTFHSYSSVKSNVLRQKYLDSQLEKYGIPNLETHLNEWNTAPYKHVRGTSFAAATAAANMCALQNTSVAMLNYYDARIGQSVYGGMFNPITYEPFCTYYSFYAFGKLYDFGTQTHCSSDNEDVYALSATNGETSGILIANIGSDTTISIDCDKHFKAFLIDENHHFAEITVDPKSFVLKENQTIYLEA